VSAASNYLTAAVLGVVEGLTEFLPVSSTAHLILLGDLLGFKGPEGKTFEIMIQLGAILALCLLYFRKLWTVLIGLPSDPMARRFAGLILVAFLPAMVLGATLNKLIKELLESHKVIAIALILGGIVMIIVELIGRRAKYREVEDVPYLTALLIGFCQAVAMIPGVSRSGATIIGGLLLGLERRTAAELSFFLAIPTMTGAFAFSAWKARHELSFDDAGLIGVGFVAAFLAALVVVKPFLAIITKSGFTPFAVYRIALGCFVLGLIYI
jgi:undecaprenyl-diphosphatase